MLLLRSIFFFILLYPYAVLGQPNPFEKSFPVKNSSASGVTADQYDDPDEQTKALFEAVFDGNLEAVETQLLAGADVDAHTDHLGNTPLLLAFQGFQNFRQSNLAFGATANPFPAIVRLLLQNGANPNIANHLKERPLAFAVLHELDECVQIILEHGVDIDDTVIKLAVSLKYARIAQLLNEYASKSCHRRGPGGPGGGDQGGSGAGFGFSALPAASGAY